MLHLVSEILTKDLYETKIIPHSPSHFSHPNPAQVSSGGTRGNTWTILF